ncbi:MAG TPA: bile acid:sodium symporter family protein, partial [Rhodothermia bacterium]
MLHVYRAGLLVAAVCAVVLAGSLLFGPPSAAGPAAVGCFVSLGIGAFGVRRLREFSFTIWIFAAVTAAMFYPQYFQNVGDFDLKVLIVPLIQVIMFGMGTRMSLKDFGAVARTPKGVLVGLACQFTIMPLMGVSLALAFRFPAEIA